MRFIVSLLFLASAAFARADVLINEFMASNTRAYPDITDFEDYPDWIELKNTGGSAVSLDGYFLSDDPSNPFKWPIPTGATISANGFLMIMADGHDTAPGVTFPRGYWPWKNFVTEKYHANFNLAAEGETLTLIHASSLTNIALINAAAPAPTPPASAGIWKYNDGGTNLSTQWRARNYNDATWASGPSELGYGDSPATVVSFGPSASDRYITTYFRHHFTVADPSIFHGLTIKVLVDDGCVIYLNGVEVARRNMPDGEIDDKTLATAQISGADESMFFTYTIPARGLVAGDNVLAVEVHQGAANSSDLSFDLALSGASHSSYLVDDLVSYTQQVSDISLGRDPAQPTEWRQFAEATPGAENTKGIVADVRVTGRPVNFSLAAGLYAAEQTVALSADGGVIHYTLDASNPTSASPIYTTPIPLATTTVVRARCFEDGKAPGPIATRTYFFGETQENVPYVSVVADPETLFGAKIGIYANQHETVTGGYGLRDVYKNKDAPANVEFFGANGTGTFSAAGGLRIGGENNWVHPQKALNFAVRAKYGTDDVTYDLFPGTQVPVHTAFTLRDGGDNWNHDMLRDGLYPKLAHGFLNVDTADYRPSIVFINGAYYGLHDVRQRWDEMWFAQQYHVAPDKIDHLLYGHITSTTTTLGVDKGSTAEWLEILNFLKTSDLTNATNWAYVESKIDLDSYIDFVVSESYGNNISWHHNREFWKECGPAGRWRWFLTDMDRTFSTGTLAGVLSDMMANEDALVRLKTSPNFKQRLAQRYAAHMAATFKPARVQAIVAEMDAEVSDLVPRHAARWAPDGTTVSVRNSQIQQIKDYATQRAANVHAELATVLGLATAVDLTLALNTPGGGTVLVQGVPVEPSTFKLFPKIPFTLQAVAAPGFAFTGWLGATGAENTTATITGATTITATFAPAPETVLGGALAADTTLTAAASPYVFSEDLMVPAGTTLTVQPGVTIHMPEGRNLRVQGILNVAGTAEAPVTIRGRAGARWGAISFEDPSGPSTLAHLVVRGATRGWDATIYNSALSGHNATVTMDFLDIRECEGPLYMFGGTAILRDSVLHNPHTGDGAHLKRGVATIQRCTFLGNNAPDTDAIDFDGVTNGVIEDCRIYRFQGSNSDGIDIGEGAHNLLIQGNLIYFNSDKGISVGQGSTVTIRKNLIVGCVLGVGIKDAGSIATLDQNTFVECETGVAVYEKNFGIGGGSAIIRNSIFSKASLAPVSRDSFSTLTAAFSLSDTVPIEGENNLLADPLFVDAAVLNFQLKPISPAVNAGDPTHAFDPDNTRADIGARYAYQTGDYPYTIGQTVVINEILANSGGESDWIELHNRTASPIDIGGWFLSDSGVDLQKYRIPLGTIIPAHGFATFYEAANFGAASVDVNKVTAFALSDLGETIYLSSAVNDQLTDYQTKEDFGPSLEGETLGAYYKHSSDTFNFVAMARATPGEANSVPRVGPIVISEIMYNPAGSGTGDAEYLELLNISAAPVTLFDATKGQPWRLSDGIDFEFPAAPPLTMAAGERVILTKNTVLFRATFGALVPAGTKILEWGLGSLSNGGETVQLDRPGAVDAANVVQYVREDRVNFDDAAPWPLTPDGHGHALTRILENNYGNDFANWMSTGPTPGQATTQTPPDADGDRMPDAYEITHGFNPFDATDADLDLDGDGQSNFVEFRDGTDPATPDALKLSASLIPPLTLSFTARAGQHYLLQSKNDLNTGAWNTVREFPVQTTTTIVDWIDGGVLFNTQRFYRIQLVTP